MLLLKGWMVKYTDILHHPHKVYTIKPSMVQCNKRE